MSKKRLAKFSRFILIITDFETLELCMSIEKQNNQIRHLHEFVSSMNIALFSAAILFLAAPMLWIPFTKIEIFIKTTFHIRQTDLVTGHFAIWIPSMALALCLWEILRVNSHKSTTVQFLRSAAGLIALFAVPIFRISTIKSYGFPYAAIPVELALIFVCTTFYLSGKWQIKFWAGETVLIVHFVFLWIVLGGYNPLPGYFGSAGILLGFCAAEAWWIYVGLSNKPSYGSDFLQGRPARI
jgi:hypothetical protein